MRANCGGFSCCFRCAALLINRRLPCLCENNNVVDDGSDSLAKRKGAINTQHKQDQEQEALPVLSTLENAEGYREDATNEPRPPRPGGSEILTLSAKKYQNIYANPGKVTLYYS